MQAEKITIEKEVCLSNEDSKHQAPSTDNEGTLSGSCSDKMVDIFEHTETEYSHSKDNDQSEPTSDEITIQLPCFDSFKSRIVETTKPKAEECTHHRELLKTFITSKACIHSKKIKKTHKKCAKVYSIQGNNDQPINIISNAGRLAPAFEVFQAEDISTECCGKAKKGLKLTKQEIKDQFGFDFDEHLLDGEVVDETHKITVQTGEEFDLGKVAIKKHIPGTKDFMIYEYKSPKNRRIIRLLNCTHKECTKVFRKWHNFFDHLRIHTQERPYKCSFDNCNQTFT